MEKNLVFISYKNSDNENLTEDSKIADALYSNLNKLGINTFYSNVSLMESGSSLYKEAIEKALDEAVILVLIGTKIEYIESKWVKYEWSNFHEDILADSKPDAIIIPYISQNIKRIEKPLPLRNLETFFLEKDTIEELSSFIINYLKSKSLLYEDINPTIYEVGIDEHSNYRAIETKERKLLKMESDLTLNTDLTIMKNLINQSDGKIKYILDVGSADGATIKARINKMEDSNLKVIGIDRDEEIIKIANLNNKDKRVSFVNIEVDSPDFEVNMKKYMQEQGIPYFDLVMITLVLRHLKNPLLALTRLKKFIKPKGYIYIREQDDGSIVSYGDKGLITKIIDKHRSIHGVADHFCGRKVYSYLNETGYINILEHHVVRDLVRKTQDEKIAIFYTQFMKRKNYIEYLVSLNPSDSILKDTLDWFTIALEKLYNYFLMPNFYFAQVDFIFWAQKL